MADAKKSTPAKAAKKPEAKVESPEPVEHSHELINPVMKSVTHADLNPAYRAVDE